MKYGSICSGVAPQTAAWSVLGLTPAWFAEIEPFPSAVLQYRFPEVPNLGDFTRIGPERGPINLLVGGTPCQSFSVAGKRAGLDDPRGNLTLEFARLAGRLRPRWLVWENVPGVLSIDGGRTFGAFLGILGKLGYGFAYRIFNAEHFGVPQRRRRVFVVGCLGNWRAAAAVLFERHSLSGDPPPRREKGEAVAGTIGGSSQDGGFRTTDLDNNGAFITHPEVINNVSSKWAKGTGGPAGDECYNLLPVTHSLRADGFDASEDGTGRGTPLVPIAFSAKDHGADAMDDCSPTLRAGGHTDSHANAGVMPAVCFESRYARNGRGAPDEIVPPLKAQSGETGKGDAAPLVAFSTGDDYGDAYEADASSVLSTLRGKVGAEAVAQWGSRILDSLQSPEVLQSWLHGRSIRCASDEFRSWVDDRPLPREEGAAAATLRKVWHEGPDGRSPQERGLARQLAYELGEALPELPSQGTFNADTLHRLRQGAERARLLRQTLSAIQEVRRSARHQSESAPTGYAVRRLTPREAERLQGFSDDFTRIPWRGKPAEECPDGNRYKAIGNSWAVPCLRWIGERLVRVDRLLRAEEVL